MNARFSDAFLVVFSTSFVHFESSLLIFLRIDVPLSSIRCALCINRSNMASARVAPPMDACHRSVRTVDSLPIVTFDSATWRRFPSGCTPRRASTISKWTPRRLMVCAICWGGRLTRLSSTTFFLIRHLHFFRLGGSLLTWSKSMPSRFASAG